MLCSENKIDWQINQMDMRYGLQKRKASSILLPNDSIYIQCNPIPNTLKYKNVLSQSKANKNSVSIFNLSLLLLDH